MPIRYVSNVNTSGLDQIRSAFAALPLTSNRALEKAVNDTRPEALADLGREPGKVRYPIQWTSEKQRKAFFATDGFGSGIPYKRTGKLADSWELLFIETRDGGSFVFTNPVPSARFVGGSLAVNRNAALRFKQKFHSNTGWQTYTDAVQDYTALIADRWRFYLSQAWVSGLSDEQIRLRGRAFTPRLR